jgi:hypothetical protein
MLEEENGIDKDKLIGELDEFEEENWVDEEKKFDGLGWIEGVIIGKFSLGLDSKLEWNLWSAGREYVLDDITKLEWVRLIWSWMTAAQSSKYWFESIRLVFTSLG